MARMGGKRPLTSAFKPLSVPSVVLIPKKTHVHFPPVMN